MSDAPVSHCARSRTGGSVLEDIVTRFDDVLVLPCTCRAEGGCDIEDPGMEPVLGHHQAA